MCLVRRTPFSIISGVFVLESIPRTALMSAGFDSPVRSSAVRKTSARRMRCRVGTFTDTVCPAHEDLTAVGPIGHPQAPEPHTPLLDTGHDEVLLRDPSMGRDEFADAGQVLHEQIVEEQVVPRVEGNAEVPRPGDRLRAVNVLSS